MDVRAMIQLGISVMYRTLATGRPAGPLRHVKPSYDRQMGKIGDRLSQVGGVIFSGGITIGVGWGIFAAQTAPDRLWDWPLWTALVMTVLGAIMLFWSFFGPDKTDKSSRLVQRQSGGAGSINIQAGRDVSYKDEGEREHASAPTGRRPLSKPSR